MPRHLLSVVLASLGLFGLMSCGKQDSAPPQISYALIFQGAGAPVGVNLAFTGDADGETLLVLPGDWGGETALYEALRLNVIQGAEVAETDQPFELLLTHEPGAWITVNYDITQDWDGIPQASGGNPYRPVIQPTYIHLIGWAALIIPQFDARDGDTDIELHWDGWPADWVVADNVATGTEPRHFTGDINRLQAGLFVAGDFTLTEVDVDGAPFRFGIRGDWPFDEAELVANIEAVVRAQRAFWSETSDTPFLVTLIPLDNGGDEGNTSWGGTGLVDSFALFATPNVGLDEFQGLAAHEFMHRWVPSAFGRVADPEEELYWFSEGFTDYFATQVQLQAGLIDLQGYADQVNTALRDYYRSPLRGTPNAEVAAQFWENRDANRYPYLHGRMFAHWANASIRELNTDRRSLISVLMWWRNYDQEQYGTPIDHEYSTDDVELAFINTYSVEAAQGVRRYIVSGEPVPILPDMFGPCFDVEDTDFPLYDLGLDLDASFNAQAATGVREDGPAYAAGVREGQRLFGYSISQIGNPNSPVTLYLEGQGGGQVPVQYLPQSDEVETIPQLVLQSPLLPSDADACVAWLVD